MKLFDINVNFLEGEKSTITIKATFLEQRDDFDRSILYSFNGLFSCYMLTMVT